MVARRAMRLLRRRHGRSLAAVRVASCRRSAQAAITSGNHAILGWHYFEGPDLHVFGLDEPANAGDLYMLQPGARPIHVTRVFDDLAKQFRLPQVEAITWTAPDGQEIEGLLYYPLDYVAGQRYPLVVQTHGGPQASDKFGFGSWSSYVQVLTAQGLRGAASRTIAAAPATATRSCATWSATTSRTPTSTSWPASTHVIALGLADPDRMVKMGWSARRPHDQQDHHLHRPLQGRVVRRRRRQLGLDVRAERHPHATARRGSAARRGRRTRRSTSTGSNSPLKDVANVKTPTIFLVGEKDVRVPPPQSVEMYRALKSNGVPTHLYVAPREPHGWTELRHQLFKMNVELDWFERWVTKRPYTWETAPDRDADSAPAR